MPTGLTEGGELLLIDIFKERSRAWGGIDRQLGMCLEVKETEWM